MEDLDPTAQLIVDGTLLQCWSCKGHPELYSGRHRTTGLSVQVACTLSGALAWGCDPHDGRVLHTGYRRPLDTFPETITAILGIIFTYTP